MTTPPPPPPPGQPDWPASQPSMAASAGTSAPQTWWTGGRIAIAIVVVLLLMGGAGFAGFLAGVAVGGTQSIMDDFEQLDGFDQEFDGAFDNDVPGIMPLDTPSTAGCVWRAYGVRMACGRALRRPRGKRRPPPVPPPPVPRLAPPMPAAAAPVPPAHMFSGLSW